MYFKMFSLSLYNNRHNKSQSSGEIDLKILSCGGKILMYCFRVADKFVCFSQLFNSG